MTLKLAPKSDQPKKSNSTAHNKLVDAILLHFGSHPHIILRKRNVAVAQTERGAKIKFGLKGETDIDGIVKRSFVAKGVTNPDGFQPLEWARDLTVGHYLAIEVKTGSGRLSKDQQDYRDAVIAMGAIYVEARSVEDVYTAISKALAVSGERL